MARSRAPFFFGHVTLPSLLLLSLSLSRCRRRCCFACTKTVSRLLCNTPVCRPPTPSLLPTPLPKRLRQLFLSRLRLLRTLTSTSTALAIHFVICCSRVVRLLLFIIFLVVVAVFIILFFLVSFFQFSIFGAAKKQFQKETKTKMEKSVCELQHAVEQKWALQCCRFSFFSVKSSFYLFSKKINSLSIFLRRIEISYIDIAVCIVFFPRN